MNPRERIVETARELFHARGFDATSVNDLIAASDTHKASFYRYFESKEEVAIEYLHRERDEFARGLQMLMQRAKNPGDFIQTWSALLIRQVKAGKFAGCRVSRLMQTLSADDTLQSEAAAVIDAWTDMLAEFLALHKAKGAFRGDPEITAEKILRLFQGTAAMYRLHKREEVFARLREDLLKEAGSPN
jgi:TetR/AcrR family transcriptional regulator, transcriptional repressor for nem operon